MAIPKKNLEVNKTILKKKKPRNIAIFLAQSRYCPEKITKNGSDMERGSKRTHVNTGQNYSTRITEGSQKET